MAAKTINELYTRLVSAVYEDDMQAQQYYLSVVESQRQISMDYMLERGFLFIPNNEYIKHYLGADAMAYGPELYAGDTCLWTLFVTIPITDLSGDVVGIVGWDALNKYKELEGEEQGLPMYKVSSKHVFKRERYFLTDVSVLKQTFSSRTVFITDGVFDSVALNYRGIPAVALLGSTFSPEVLYFLRWYRKIYVCADNDKAGLTLYSKLNRALPGVHRVIQGNTKDIEELLRTDGKDGPLTKLLLQGMSPKFSGDIILPTEKGARL